MAGRKEFLQNMARLGVAFALPDQIAGKAGIEQRLGEYINFFDGQTILEAQNMPVLVQDLYGGKTLYCVLLDGIDFQMYKPFCGKAEIVQRDQDLARPLSNKVLVQDIYATMPTVTGKFAHFVANPGYFYDTEGQIRLSVRAYSKKEAFSTYCMICRYYDNKVVNASEAILSLARTIKSSPVPPEGVFSYIEATKIKELEMAGDGRVLMGKGLYPSKTKTGQLELGNMFAGGICVSAAVLAKAVQQLAVRKQMVEIVERHPHGNDGSWWYFMNPDDKDPQVDATINWQTKTDFKFKNNSSKNLFVVPKIRIIPDHLLFVPRNYNGLENTTATFAMSITLRSTPPTDEEILSIESQLQSFRALRKI